MNAELHPHDQAAHGDNAVELLELGPPEVAGLWTTFDEARASAASVQAVQQLAAPDAPRGPIVYARQRTIFHVVPFYVIGTTAIDRQLLDFPGEGQWELYRVLAWADPAASGTIQVALTVDQSLPIPLPVQCSANQLASSEVGLPIADKPTVRLVPTPYASSTTDRGVVLLVFRRCD